MEHIFQGKWITDEEFFELKPRNVFHKQFEKVELPCDEHRNRHILFRKEFICDSLTENATLYISADDYYKLYINGQFVAQGPAPAYHFNYNYNVIDVRKYLQKGENLIAVHTLYQGIINRVWQSADNRHGLLLDLVIDGETVVASDESFKTTPHTAYTELRECGYHKPLLLERYDSNAPEIHFEQLDYDDTHWKNAKLHQYADYTVALQKSSMLTFETVAPVTVTRKEDRVIYDFGANYVGYFCATARGNKGDVITVRCGNELNDDGTVRYKLRATCTYEEEWVLCDGESVLDWFDYKAFRYVEMVLPPHIALRQVYLNVRHYPFALKASMKSEYANDPDMQRIWDLCVQTQKYGVQEVIQDCMDREKGFYLGDGCYTSLVNLILTDDDSMVRKLIDDAFSTTFITDTLVACIDCSLMQEIAEFPLILVYLVLWHYNFTGDKEYLMQNYAKVTQLLNAYQRNYEKNGLLRNVDKWCVVEWPPNFRHGYDVDIRDGQICKEAHVSLNAYYLAAVRTANAMAAILDLPQYRDETPLMSAFYDAFYDRDSHLFKDGENTEHISLVGNSFVYGFGLCSEDAFLQSFFSLFNAHGISSLSFFCTFPVLMGFVRERRYDLIKQCLLDDGTWKRMLREGATTTFEGWGKDTKRNASLFHLTMSYAAIFMADIDLNQLFHGI